MIIDVIMLSGSHDAEAVDMTQKAIDSLLTSESGIEFNLILVESQFSSKDALEAQGIDYAADKLIFPCEDKFNYNKFINYAIPFLKGEYVVISNNDVVFYPNWATNALSQMATHSLQSCSCISPGWFLHDQYQTLQNPVLGFSTSTLFCGWNLIFERAVFDQLCPLDEQFDYCFQDNDLAEQLQKLGCRHALIPTAKVRHLVSRSRRYFNQDQFDRDFRAAQERFQNKWS